MIKANINHNDDDHHHHHDSDEDHHHGIVHHHGDMDDDHHHDYDHEASGNGAINNIFSGLVLDGGSQLNDHWNNFKNFFQNSFDTSSLFQLNTNLNLDSASDAVSDIAERASDGILQNDNPLSDIASDSLNGDVVSDSAERVSDVITDIAPEFDVRPAPDFSIPSLEIEDFEFNS